MYFRTQAFLLLVFLCLHCYGATGQKTESFSHWAREHGKVYKSLQDAILREKVYQQNLLEIEQLNQKYRGRTEFTANQFADLTPEEFQEKVLMPRRPGVDFPQDRYLDIGPVDSLPDSFDWTTQGKVTSVKDQGSVGTCWAFSTVGNIEGQWVMQGKPLTNLSVEQLVECDGTMDPEQKRADCGVFGGWPYLAYQYVERAGGLETWTNYSYCSGNKDPCFPCKPPGYNKTYCGPSVPYCLKNESCAAKINPQRFVPGLKVTDWKAISQNETEMAAALMKYGPLSVALDASRLQFYRRGVYDPFDCSKTALDHAVLVVGFGSEKEIFKTHPYWKVKNSWGAKWGEEGYFNIQRGAGMCGINTQVTTAQLAT
ncbi:cysteine proteinase 1-like [Haliotis rubra]|uniref:cysteine proteinase 1-like n=1 Tax=Haliotis rubra TaxID=36100 RepID=UPI001EE5B53C|nr:cysteine proteinase 1-like [Haliotis rubra]